MKDNLSPQDAAIARQQSLVDDARKIAEALRADPSPELIEMLVSEARIDAATRLRNHSTYLFRLESRDIDAEEVSRSLNVQARFRSQQAELMLALGLEA